MIYTMCVETNPEQTFEKRGASLLIHIRWFVGRSKGSKITSLRNNMVNHAKNVRMAVHNENTLNNPVLILCLIHKLFSGR